MGANSTLRAISEMMQISCDFSKGSSFDLWTMRGFPIHHARYKSVVRPLFYLVQSLEPAPSIVGVESPGSTVGSLLTRVFAAIFINTISLSNWFPIVPVENGARQSTAPLTSMGPAIGAI